MRNIKFSQLKRLAFEVITLALFQVSFLTHVNAQTEVKGTNVTEVTVGKQNLYPGGAYRLVGDKVWHGTYSGLQKVVICNETRRDESSVYLSCPENTTVVLNLLKKEVTVTGFAGSTLTLGPIVGSKAGVIEPAKAPTSPSDAGQTGVVTRPAGSAPPKAGVGVCPNGYISNADRVCVTRIWFYEQPSVTLEQARRIAETNGWTVASPAQITSAWNDGVIDAYVVGMLSDGNVAMPIQRDYSGFKSGPNFGANGKTAVGFFYTLKEAAVTVQKRSASVVMADQVTITPAGPTVVQKPSSGTPVSGALSGTLSAAPPDAVVEYFSVFPNAELFKPMHCQKGLKNFMLDGWDSPSRPILDEAARSWLAKKGLPSNFQTKLINDLRSRSAESDVTRWEFAPFMLRTAWQALVSPNPNPAQLAFRQNFESYAACDENRLNQITLTAWNLHIGKRDERTGLIAAPQPYKPATLSVLMNTGPTTKGFLPRENPLELGYRGQVAINLLYKPMLVKNLPEYDDRENLRSLDEEMTKTAAAVGIGSAFGGGAVFSAAVGSIHVYLGVKKALFTSAANAAIKANDLAAAGAKTVAQEAGKKLTQVLTRNVTAKILSGAAGPVLAGAAFFATVFGEVVAEHVKTAEYDAALRKGAQYVVPLDVKTYLASGTEDEINAKKVKLFTQLVKMTIADPADAEMLTMALPEFPCRPGEIREKAGGYCIREVKFHAAPSLTRQQAETVALQNGWQLASSKETEEAWEYLSLDLNSSAMMADGRFAMPLQKDLATLKRGTNIKDNAPNQGFLYVQKRIEFQPENNLTLAQAQDGAARLGGRLATPQEVQIAWERHGLHNFAYSMMSDGRFAIPLQTDVSTFKRGANIGVTGGNQGFLFVRDGEPWRYYRGQEAMQCASGSVYDAGLCYTPCRAGYGGVGPLCSKPCPAGFRDDGLYCGKPAAYSRPGYGWVPGDPPLPNYSGPVGRCETNHGKGNCEQAGAVIYQKCRQGFFGIGDTCSPSCPTGMNDIGASCEKDSYPRGVGKPVSECKPGMEKVGLLCYPYCRKGYNGVLDWCYNPTGVK